MPRIFASGSLDECAIAELRGGGAPIDAYGVGTKMGVSADAPYLDSAYKLVQFGGRPVMKLSKGKATLPGAKQVHRGNSGDIIALRDEPPRWPAGVARCGPRVLRNEPVGPAIMRAVPARRLARPGGDQPGARRAPGPARQPARNRCQG